ncbi:loricrin-like protein [Rhynchospora pubera]|uniref:Loricrin-like protein n=1 Tax=Rhynchospora pubera TaxID=906938 RepID=A0AAV8D053_9POAL|nr:loricrin-like protein [Rhynchospora pubera]
MDLNMANVIIHGQVGPTSTNCNMDSFGGPALHLGSSYAQNSNHVPPQDDGCRLVLGLGPTPNLYSSDNHLALSSKTGDSTVLFGQRFSSVDPGILKLGLPKPSAETNQLSPPTEKSHRFPIVDEGSTSAKRNSGGYMPSLLFAPRPTTSGSNFSGAPQETRDLLDLQLSPEPSATTDCSLGTTSEIVFGTTVTTNSVSTDSRTHHRHPKKCRFKGCSKGARGASGLCIAHGGGQRCQKPGCNKGAESRTAYCKAHGGGRRCQQLGCTKSAEGKTEYCIAHGGGRRCGHQGCNKAARGKSGLCIRHGGGKRCKIEGCTRSAEGQAGLCISHGGGRRCQYPDCAKGAQGSTMFCKAHGGGKRCIFEGCTKGAEGSTPLCKGHGGGKRCLFEGGGVCPKSVHGGTNFCVAHGGGKRCKVDGCSKSARGRTDYCVKHGGGKRCKHEGCGKSAQGSTDFCKAHGGGKRCTWSTGCEKFARGKSGLCAAHGSLMAAQMEQTAGKAKSMIAPGLFRGIVSSSTRGGNSLENENSYSGMSTLSDCVESPDGTNRKKQLLIPPQVLVPLSMKSYSNNSMAGSVRPGGREGAAFVVPEGRVHGGGLMSLFGGNLRNAVDGGNV